MSGGGDIRFQSTTVSDAPSSSAKLERIGAHSHIRGLGLNELLEAQLGGGGGGGGEGGEGSGSAARVSRAASSSVGGGGVGCSFVGQADARRSMGVLLKLIQKGRLAGRGILLAGPPSTGKTALAHALSSELGSNVPFVSVSASQVYSSQRSKTEFLSQSVRRAMAVSIEEETEVIEGEVVEIQTSTALELGKSSGRITLCTTEMETIYDLGHKMLEQLRKEKVSSGDVIRIDKGGGKISKLGRSFSRSRDYDAISSATKFVSTPDGELQKRKTTTHVVSLHEMDVINSRQQGFLALFSGDTGEISGELRAQVDAKVAEWREEGRAKLVSGVLFIDEVHLLDLDCFSFLNSALEQPLAPVLVIATNRGMSPIRGAGSKHASPHGIPADFLDRLLIVSTEPYRDDELRQILHVRAVQEETDLEETALELLTRIAGQTSLRYAMQLIALSQLRATRRAGGRRDGPARVTMDDVEAVYGLFYDVKRSTQLVLESPHTFLFHETGGDEKDDEGDDNNEDAPMVEGSCPTLAPLRKTPTSSNGPTGLSRC